MITIKNNFYIILNKIKIYLLNQKKIIKKWNFIINNNINIQFIKINCNYITIKVNKDKCTFNIEEKIKIEKNKLIRKKIQKKYKKIKIKYI